MQKSKVKLSEKLLVVRRAGPPSHKATDGQALLRPMDYGRAGPPSHKATDGQGPPKAMPEVGKQAPSDDWI